MQKLLSKKILIPMAALAVIGAGVVGVAGVSAATDTSDPQASLIQKLTDTFHLDKSKVQAVFDQQRQENQANREANYETKLDQLVTDGKITSAQKTAILAENKKLKAELDAAKDSTDKTARRTAMKNVRTEARDWAQQNNLDEHYLMGGIGGHPRGGMGPGMMGPGPDDDGTPPAGTPAQ
ncbi:MAG TPA: hypothetical protein VHQ86_03805 [Candidatus Saccharimonadia bacterium]|nr:hypothetical protein [Candidatus Saccharimonadia bacterium]